VNWDWNIVAVYYIDNNDMDALVSGEFGVIYIIDYKYTYDAFDPEEYYEQNGYYWGEGD